MSYTSFFKNFILQLANAYTPYSSGLYSCHTPLVQKCTERNFHMRTRGYHVRAGAPELRELLEWCPKDGALTFPWTLPSEMSGYSCLIGARHRFLLRLLECERVRHQGLILARIAQGV